jgi:hypothetical protein
MYPLSHRLRPNRARAQDVCASGTVARRSRLLSGGWTRATFLAGAGLFAIATPIALGAGGAPRSQTGIPVATAAATQASPIRGGIHNPPNSHYANTTGVFAKNPSWATRVENVGHGGAAFFGCHSSAGNLPCLDVDNLTGGPTFTFDTTGNTGGEILLTNTNGAPFTTNAHGVAVGLNANFLQGKQANEFQLANQPAANATELGGRPASSYVSTGQLLFADVVPGPKIENGREATSVTSLGTEYKVTFGTLEVNKCSYTASPQGEPLTTGQLGVEADSSNASIVIVKAPGALPGGFDLQVVC